MSVKVLCPQCRTEIYDPEDLKKVLCHTCSTLFDVDAQVTVVSPSAGPRPSGQADVPPPSRVGKYEIRSEISRGGMGIVYKAYQRELDRAVALKVVSPDLAEVPEFVERFFREAKTLARLNHPNIVQVYDADRDGARLYLVMELVDGTSLRALMKKGRVPPAEALRLGAQICDALGAAHQQGIVHRDIKPENILITSSGQVKVADFGLAVLFTSTPETPRITQSNVVLGTYDYMSPEQRQGAAAVDHRGDLYSLGVVLYELLTGRLPVGRFEAPSVLAGTPPALDQVIYKALEQDPERRWSRADQIRAALAPAPSAPPPAPADGKKARIPGPVAVGLAAVVLGAVALAGWRARTDGLRARAKPAEAALGHLRVGADRRLEGTRARTLDEHFAKIAPGAVVDVEMDPSSPPQRQSEVLDAAAKRGVSVRFVTGESRLMKLHITPNQRLRVEDYALVTGRKIESFAVFDRQDVLCVEFLRFKKGEIRRWRELQVTFQEIAPDSMVVEVEIKPGAACFGAGAYAVVQSGLRVDFPGNRSVTLSDFDAEKAQARVVFESGGQKEEREIRPGSEGRTFDIYYRLLHDGREGWWRWIVDEF